MKRYNICHSANSKSICLNLINLLKYFADLAEADVQRFAVAGRGKKLLFDLNEYPERTEPLSLGVGDRGCFIFDLKSNFSNVDKFIFLTSINKDCGASTFCVNF